MSTQDIKVRIGLEGADQVAAGASRAAQAMGTLDANARRFGQGAQISGQQTAQLSAQLQDFAIQVQSGGNPLTAFLQQGSQLSAVFGGAGNALRAVASLITPTVAAFGAAAAAIGTVAFAYAKGEAERMAFQRGIVSTGNAAGVTAGQLVELARAAQAYGSTQGEASGVLAQLVATGRVAGTVLGQAAEAAVRLERSGVSSVKETVAAFADLGKAPLEGLLRLNETQNFLTLSTYRQVKALQDAGREAEAARVAQEAFAASGIERGKQLEQSLGTLASGWRDLKKEILGALDAIADIGRAKPPEGAVADIDRRLSQLQLRRQSGRRVDSNTASDFLASQDDIEREAQALEKLRAQLQAGVETQRQLAAAQAQRAAETKRQIEADEKAADAAKKHAEAMRQQAQAQIAAGVAQARGGALSEAGFNPDFLSKYRELQAALRAGAISATEFEQAHRRLIQQQPVFVKQQAEMARVLRESEAARERDLKAMQASATASERQVETLREQYIQLTGGKDALRQYTDLRLEDAIAIAEQRLQSLQLVAASAEELAAAQRNVQALREQLALRRAIAGASADQALAEAARKVAADEQAERQRLYDDYRDGLTQAFRNAFSQGGNFARNFARGLATEVQTRLAASMSAVLADSLLALVGVGAASFSGSGGGGKAGASGGLLQGASTLQSAYNLYNGGGVWGMAYNSAGLASALGLNSAAAYGAAIGTTNVAAGSQAAMLAAQTEGFGLAGTWATSQAAAVPLTGYTNATAAYQAMVQQQTLAAYGVESAGAAASTGGAGAASSLGAYMGYAALIYAAAKLGSSLYDKGFTGSAQLDGKAWYDYSFEKGKTDLLRGIGLSDKWAEILGGSVRLNHVFGRSAPQLTDTGVTGTLGQGGFAGEQYAIYTQKGGLFRSDKATGFYQAPGAELQNLLSESAKKVYDEAFKYGQALALPTAALEKVNTALAVSFGSDEKANVEALQKALSQYAQDLVSAYGDAVTPLKRYGEDVVQTIARVSTAINDVNAVLSALGSQKIQASVQGGQAAVSLLDIFGGIGGLQQSAGSFLQNFFSEAERRTLARANIGSALADVGLALPGTRDEYRATVQQLIDGGALLTESGRQQVAVLLQLAGAFAETTEAARDAAQLVAERAQLQDQLDRLLGNDAAILARERERIDPSNRDLFDQIQQARSDKTAAEVAAQAERERLAAAQSASQAWQQTAQAVADSAAAVRQAMEQAGQGIVDEILRLRGVNPSQPTAAGVAAVRAQFEIAAIQAKAGDASAASQLPTLSRTMVELAARLASSTGEIELIKAQTAATLEQVLRAQGLRGVPQFADGGWHAGGWRLVGERGPELELTGPSRIYSAEQTRDMLAGGGSAEMLTELRNLRSVVEAQGRDLAQLRHLAAIADSTDEAQRVLRQVTNGGNAMLTEPV